MRNLFIVVLTGIALTATICGQNIPPAGTWVVSPADDTKYIQYVIDNTPGTIFFKAGIYQLSGPLKLRSGVTYIGEGSYRNALPYGSVLMQTAISPDNLGTPIFTVENVVSSVTISGLTFLRPPGVTARGIVAVGANSMLVNSIIRENAFLAEIADCIVTPMVSTRIERNEFGKNGSREPNGTEINPRHRHIQSARPAVVPNTNDNWIIGNIFRGAYGSESIYFDSAVNLHVIGNDFEENDVDTTLRLRGTSHVEGNWFETNRGEALMTFANTANYSVQLENNFYVMQGLPGTVNSCKGNLVQGNCYLFKPDAQKATGTVRVRLGFEMGRAFDPAMDLTNSTGLSLLTFSGPLCFNANYKGTQAGPHLLDCPQTGGIAYGGKL